MLPISVSLASCLFEHYEVKKKGRLEWFHCVPSSLPPFPGPDTNRAAVVAVTRRASIAQPASLSLAASSLALVSRATVHS